MAKWRELYVEGNESLLTILGDGFGQAIPAHAQLIVTLDVAQFDQSDESSLFHRAVSLSIPTANHINSMSTLID